MESQAGLNKYLNKHSTGVPAAGQQFSCQNCTALSSCTARAVQQGPGIKNVHTSIMVEEREQHTCLIWFWTGFQPANPKTAAHVCWEQLARQGELEPGGHRMGDTQSVPSASRGSVPSSLPIIQVSHGLCAAVVTSKPESKGEAIQALCWVVDAGFEPREDTGGRELLHQELPSSASWKPLQSISHRDGEHWQYLLNVLC